MPGLPPRPSSDEPHAPGAASGPQATGPLAQGSAPLGAVPPAGQALPAPMPPLGAPPPMPPVGAPPPESKPKATDKLGAAKLPPAPNGAKPSLMAPSGRHAQPTAPTAAKAQASASQAQAPAGQAQAAAPQAQQGATKAPLATKGEASPKAGPRASGGSGKSFHTQGAVLSPSGHLNPLEGGHQAFQLGDFARAAALYEQAVRAALGEVEPLVAWGMALQRAGRHDEARKRYAEARRLEPGSGKLAFLEGVQALALGDRPGAREALEACVALSPEAGPAWFFLGQLRRDAGEGEAAEAAYAQAQKLVPDLPPVATHRAINALERGRLDEALAFASAGAKGQPKDPYAWMVLGAVHAARLEWELSVRAHRKAATEAPALAEPFFRLGHLLYEQKQLDEARECFLLALEREPRHLASLMALGLIEGAMGSHETALACFEAAATIRPNWPDVAFWRGVALANLDRGTDAHEAFAKAASQAPGSPMIAGALAAFAPEGIMNAGMGPPEARA